MSKTYRHLRQDQANTFHKRQKARDGVWRRGKTEFNSRSRQDTPEFVEGTHSAVPPRAVVATGGAARLPRGRCLEPSTLAANGAN